MDGGPLALADAGVDGSIDSGDRRGARPVADAAADTAIDVTPDLPVDATPDAPIDTDPPVGRASPACLEALSHARFDFESGAQGFTHAAMDGVSSSTWTIDPWEVGTPTTGPGRCASGSGCFATHLHSNYAQCQRAELRSPAVDLSACAGEDVVLVFDHYFDFWTDLYGFDLWFDGGIVEVAYGGGTFERVTAGTTGTVYVNPSRGFGYSCLSPSFYVNAREGYVASSGGYTRVTVPVHVDEGGIVVRFAFASGVSSETTNEIESRAATRPGWYVDDVRFELRD